MVYGESEEKAVRAVKALALRVVADRIEQDASTPQVIEFASLSKPA